MAVVLRLMRSGAKKRPFYRIVAADSRRQRDGRFLEILGHYDPLKNPHTLVLKQEPIAVWLQNGAVPSDQVASLLRQAGIKMGTASKPKAAAKTTTKAGAKPKAAKKRAVKKTPSDRKVKARAARKAGKGKPKVAKAKKK